MEIFCLSGNFTPPPYRDGIHRAAQNSIAQKEKRDMSDVHRLRPGRLLPDQWRRMWRHWGGAGEGQSALAAPRAEIGKASFDYLPVLDGLRAISILLVVFSHADLGNIVPGGLGVTVFFVISGFLITRQMIAEIAATGSLSFSAFYLRRVFRLAPALLLYLAMFTSLFLALGAHMSAWQVASGIFYVANYYHIFIGYPPLNPNPILWSLSIEEHFYLVAPFIVFLFRRKLPTLLPYMVLAFLLVPLWRFYIFQLCAGDPHAAMCGVEAGARRFRATDTLFDCIVYGCVMAVLLHFYWRQAARLMRSAAPAWLAAALLLTSLLIRNPLFRESLRYSLQAGAVAVIMTALLYGRWPWVSRLLCLPPILLIGRLSYSLYLFHFGVATLIVFLFPGRSFLNPAILALFLAGSFGLAGFSYFFVERPMVAVRKRFSAARRLRGAPKTVTPDRAGAMVYSTHPRDVPDNPPRHDAPVAGASHSKQR
jgi:peptidoglycan/LPS O-acetylase OafA/YrhL